MVTFDFSKLWDIPVVDRQIGLESFDAIRVVEWNNFYINVTVFNSWLVILLITLTAWLTTRNLSTQKQVSKWPTKPAARAPINI